MLIFVCSVISHASSADEGGEVGFIPGDRQFSLRHTLQQLPYGRVFDDAP